MDNFKDKTWIFLMNKFSLTCHQKSERSFFMGRYQFPICARCTGLLLGYLIGVMYWAFTKEINLMVSFIFLIIMFIDWFIQYKGIKKSTNYRRLITGILCGVGIIGVLANFYVFIIMLYNSMLAV